MLGRLNDKEENEEMNERNLLNNLKSNNETIRLKALSFARKNFNYLNNYTIIGLSKDIPKFLSDSNSDIVENALNIILLSFSGNMQEHLEGQKIMIAILEKSMMFNIKNLNDKCELIINMFLQNMEASEYLSILKQVLKNENSSVMLNAFKFISMGLEEFGIRNLNYLKEMFPILENSMKGTNEALIEGVLYLYKQIYKYMGENLNDSIAKLPKAAQKDINKFTSSWGKIKLTGKRDIGLLQEQDETDGETNIWSKYTDEWSKRIMGIEHWKDKLPELRSLERDLNVSRLSKGNYSKVLEVLKSCTADAHVLIKIKSIKSIGLLCQGLKKDFKEYISIFNFLLPFFKSNTKRIIEVLNETMDIISNYLKLPEITHTVIDALIDNNPDYKMNLLHFLEMIIKLKLDNNLVNEVEYFKNHSEKIFMDLCEDPKLEVRNKAKKLNNLLKERLMGIRMSISESFSSFEKQKCLSKLGNEFSEISDIGNEGSKISQQSPINRKSDKFDSSIKTMDYKNLEKRNTIVIKPLEIKKRNTFLVSKESSKNFLPLIKSNNEVTPIKNYMSTNKLDTFESIGSNNYMSNYVNKPNNNLKNNLVKNLNLNFNNNFKPMNLNLIEPQMEKSIGGYSQDESFIIEKIDWKLKKEKLIKNIIKVFEKYEDIPSEELNDILLKLQKETNDFREIMILKEFYVFCKIISMKDYIDINEKTFLILKNILSQDLQKGKKLGVTFTEKLVHHIGPFRFFKLILNYIYERGFSHKNFFFIVYQLLQNIPPDLLYDAHVVLLYRNIKYYFSQQFDFEKDFLNLLHHIIQPRIFYLKELYPELEYINFSELYEIEEVEYIKFPDIYYEEMKQLCQEATQDNSQGIVDINEDIKIILDFMKNNPKKKKEILDKFFILLLKNPKFSFNRKLYDSKIQDLLMYCLDSNESNKLIVKAFTRIIFLYSHCCNENNFKISSKFLNNWINLFLKDKNEDVRKIFAIVLKKHILLDKPTEIYNYFKFLEDKNSFIKIELLEIFFDFFDHQSEKFILKINDKKVFPVLFNLLNTKKNEIKIKATNLLNFFLSFFPEQKMKEKAAKVSKEALDFVSNFYLLRAHNRIETVDKSLKIESNNSFKDSRNEKKDTSNNSASFNQIYPPTMKFNNNISDDFIDFNKLETLNLPYIIENIGEAINNVLHFKIAECFRSVLFQNALNNLPQCEMFLKKMLDLKFILKGNMIPFFLSILYNFIMRYQKSEIFQMFCLNNLSVFVDSLKTEDDNLFCLESEEFSLFTEIISKMEFKTNEQIEVRDQIVQNTILYHIQTEEKIDIINLIRSLTPNNEWLETHLLTEKIEDIFESEDHDSLNPVEKIIYSFAFATKDYILDILIENKFFNNMEEDDNKDLIIAFIFLMKRMKKTIILNNAFNENFLNFIMNKFEEIIISDLEDINEEILRDVFKVMVEILFLPTTFYHPKLLSFLKNLTINLNKEKIVASLTLLNFHNEEQDSYLNTLLVKALENETTDFLIDVCQNARLVDYDNKFREKSCTIELNKIGLYLVDIVKKQEKIEQDLKEIDKLNLLIEEYNNFEW